jgi:hypothetical protein
VHGIVLPLINFTLVVYIIEVIRYRDESHRNGMKNELPAGSRLKDNHYE